MFEYLNELRNSKRLFRERQNLFHRDDPVKFMFLIASGTAQLIRHHPNGSAVVLQRAQAGSVLAEASLFAPAYHCDAVALSDVEAHLVSRTAMQNLFQTNQEFAKAWVAHLGQEVRNARLRAEILTLKTVAERLDAWLVDNGHLPAKGGWRTLAHQIGTSPEALYREIARRNI